MTSVTFKYDEEKLNAIKQYMLKKDTGLDAELEEFMNKLWDKYVPQAVREYIESREVTAGNARKSVKRMAGKRENGGIAESGGSMEEPVE